MKLKEVATMIKSIGLPYAYYQFKENSAPALPYLVFYYPNNSDMHADNINYQKINALNIELYSENKSFTDEKKVEDVLEANGITYTKTESYLSDEKMFEVLYESEVLING